MVRYLLHSAMALTMLFVAVATPLLRGVVQGDTNGDAAVDVLDLQHVIAEVLGTDVDMDHGDINHDGHVNVLDFQALLSQAQQARSSQSGDLPQPDKSVPVQVRVADEMGLRVSYVKPVAPEEGKSAASFAARPALMEQVASPKVERYIQNLSPNAPPVLG